MPKIQLERRVIAPTLVVWRALSTIHGMKLWQADEVKGYVKRGEALTLSWPQLGAEVTLEVTELVSGRRIALCDGHSELLLEVVPGGVRLTQEFVVPVPSADLDGLTSSWRLALSQLAHSLERHPGSVRHSDWSWRLLPVSAAQLHRLATVPDFAERWLWRWNGAVGDPPSTGELVGAEGSEVALRFYEGQALSGRVLCHAPSRDISLCWEEEGASTLSLRTLPSPFTEHERLVALVWSRWYPPDLNLRPHQVRAERTRQGLEALLDRLARLVGTLGQA